MKGSNSKANKVCLSLAGGESTFTLGKMSKLDRILKESPDMKRQDVKRWLRSKEMLLPSQKKIKMAKSKEGSSERIAKKYLMSEQEIKQDEIMDAIFTKFD